MSEPQRKFVLENLLVAGNPLIPGDSSFQHELLPEDHPESENAAVAFPGIQARLVLPLSGSGRTLVRADKLYDVHYHLLSFASLADYQDRFVYYTAYSLIKEMGWREGGRQTQLVRDSVDYLWRTTLEIEGEMPDVLVPNVSADQVRSFRILIGRGYPKQEERRSGARNLSFIEYHPSYLASIANDPGVQLDVELLSQIPGTLGKAFYRTASWLRTLGSDRVELGELFERAGSTRSRTLPSDAIRVFSGAWEMMQRYRFLRSEPRFEKLGSGQYHLILDWGDPVVLPSKGDSLFRAITDAGVNPRTAEQMIRDDRRKAMRIMQAFRAGALGKPYTTPAAQVVGAFNKEDWDFEHHLPSEDQMDLLARDIPSRAVGDERPSREAPAPREVDWERVIDWADFARAQRGWQAMEREVLAPILAACGEADPGRVLFIPALRERFQTAFGRLGWTAMLEAIYGAAAYLDTAARPASYLATVLENEAAGVPDVSERSAPPREGPVALKPPPSPRSEPRSGDDLSRIGFDLAGFKLAELRSWLDVLEREPNRLNARRAGQFAASRLEAQPTDVEVLKLLRQIQEKAEAILA